VQECHDQRKNCTNYLKVGSKQNHHI
jgi:hypothetical protein